MFRGIRLRPPSAPQARRALSSLIEQQHRVASGGNIGGNRSEMHIHHRRVAPGQDQADCLALFGTDGAEDVGRGGALI
jgi:hypothetical protein